MEFTLRKASDWDFEETITIDTLEDLKKLQKRYNTSPDEFYWDNVRLILDFSRAEITIYDTYIE